MSNRANIEDKSLKGVEDKALKAGEDKTTPVEGEVLAAPSTIIVELVHHTEYGVPGETVAVEASVANQLVVSARAKLV